MPCPAVPCPVLSCPVLFRVMCHASCVMRHASCVMCHVSHVMCNSSPVMCHVSSNVSKYVACVLYCMHTDIVIGESEHTSAHVTHRNAIAQSRQSNLCLMLRYDDVMKVRRDETHDAMRYIILSRLAPSRLTMRGWRNTVGNLIEIVWFTEAYHGPQSTGIPVNNRGLRLHRIRDFKLYNFNSIPPTSHMRRRPWHGVARCRTAWHAEGLSYNIKPYIIISYNIS